MGNATKTHKDEDFVNYRAAKPSGIIRFCTLPVYRTVP
jgi:hypothetical protein